MMNVSSMTASDNFRSPQTINTSLSKFTILKRLWQLRSLTKYRKKYIQDFSLDQLN